MARTSAKDVFDLCDTYRDQDRLQAIFQLDQVKRRSYTFMNGLGSPMKRRIEEKKRLLAYLRETGQWGEDEQ